MAAIQYYHPKRSGVEAGSEGETDEWGGHLQNSWLEVMFNGVRMHPDGRWGETLGTSYGDGKITIARISIITGVIDDAQTRRVIAHEVCHATRSFFRRANIRNDNASDPDCDHSTSPGLMNPSNNPLNPQTKFSSAEQKIIRGGARP